MSKTCETCRFWNRDHYSTQSQKGLGVCMRFPPTVLATASYGLWPTLHDANWCGEHQPREQEPEKPKEREPGWYWVKRRGRSIIAEWCDWEGWRIDGTEYVKEAARQISPRLEPPV